MKIENGHSNRTQNSTATLAYRFNSSGYRTYWQKYEIYFISLRIGPRYTQSLERGYMFVYCVLHNELYEPGARKIAENWLASLYITIHASTCLQGG